MMKPRSAPVTSMAESSTSASTSSSTRPDPSARSPSSSAAICRSSLAAATALRSTDGASSSTKKTIAVSPACPSRMSSPCASTRSVDALAVHERAEARLAVVERADAVLDDDLGVERARRRRRSGAGRYRSGGRSENSGLSIGTMRRPSVSVTTSRGAGVGMSRPGEAHYMRTPRPRFRLTVESRHTRTYETTSFPDARAGAGARRGRRGPPGAARRRRPAPVRPGGRLERAVLDRHVRRRRRSRARWTRGSPTRERRSTGCSPSRRRARSTTRSEPYDDVLLELDAVGVAGRAHPGGASGRQRSGRPPKQVSQKVSAFATELSLNRGVYDALAGLDVSTADAETQYYVQRTLRDFRLAGVDKDDATRKRIQQLRDELVVIGQDFDRNIRDGPAHGHREERRGARRPARRLHRAPQAGPGRRHHAHHRLPRLAARVLVREERGPAQADVHGVPEPRLPGEHGGARSGCSRARAELARLLGFSNWADYITADKMVGTREAGVRLHRSDRRRVGPEGRARVRRRS